VLDLRILSIALIDILHELIDVIGPTVGQLSLGQRPDSFIGVEFRGIGGKVLDGKTWMLAKIEFQMEIRSAQFASGLPNAATTALPTDWGPLNLP
jgi:hypothetical protein